MNHTSPCLKINLLNKDLFKGVILLSFIIPFASLNISTNEDAGSPQAVRGRLFRHDGIFKRRYRNECGMTSFSGEDAGSPQQVRGRLFRYDCISYVEAGGTSVPIQRAE